MYLSLNWIREFCPFSTTDSPRDIGARFSIHAAEVEDVLPRGEALPSISVARVLDVAKHPDADRLSVCRVETGDGEAEIVCGAPNVRAGMTVPLAKPGVTVAGHKIRAAKVRGVRSAGMLCSQRELGVSEDGNGLWELEADLEAGVLLTEAYPELCDTVLEVDNKSLTHRPDLWGHYGLAREFSAIYGEPLLPLEVDETLATASGDAGIRVAEFEGDVASARLCRRYCGLRIDGIHVGPSPAWLQHRLWAIGSRPINNIVDVTNYILFELGQPLHAFDSAKVRGGIIHVRRGGEGENLPLLDGSEVTLGPDALVIADADGPVALAGVMGGGGSEISEATTSVFLESANFDPSNVRRTSVKHSKRTDSSMRFEKSLDPENARTGILRAAAMILRLCPDAKVVGALQDVGYEPPSPIEIQTTPEFLHRRLGKELEVDESRGILERLGFGVDERGDEGWTVRVPSWRATKDVSIQEDLVEEIGRIHGYDNIEPYAPEWPVEAVPVNESRATERRAKEFLALHGGLDEVYTYNLIGPAHCERFGLDPELHLKLLNPMNEDMDRLRREIVPVLLEKAQANQRFFERFGLFELGRVFKKDAANLRSPELPEEVSRLSAVLSFPKRAPENFDALRHTVVTLLETLRCAAIEISPWEPDSGTDLPAWVHPSVAGLVSLSDSPVGYLYRIHPRIEQSLDLRGEVMAFDLDFDSIVRCPKREPDYRPPRKFPTVGFDVAVVVPARALVRDVNAVIAEAAGARLLSSEVFDVFPLDDGSRSVAFHLVFGSDEQTLDGEAVTALQDAVVAALEGAGYTLRS